MNTENNEDFDINSDVSQSKHKHSHHSSSHEHSHHSSSHEHSHHNTEKKEHSSKYKKKSEYDKNPSNLMEAITKVKKKKLYVRILFIVAVVAVISGIVVLMINGDKIMHIERTKTEVDMLKEELQQKEADIMNLKYELEKYEDLYGKLDEEYEKDDNTKKSNSKDNNESSEK